MYFRMKKITLLTTSSLLTFSLLSSPSFGIEPEVETSLKECTLLADNITRLSCFDDLTKDFFKVEVVQQSSTEVESISQKEQTSETETLPESLGGGEYADKAGVKPTEYRGKVVSCQKAHDRKWFYIFDNKQVWKQVDRRKLRYRYGCDFKVTIYRGSFGYIMLVDGDQGKIQVKRHR